MLPINRGDVSDISVHTVTRLRNKKRIEYIDMSCAFDIETTSTYINNGKTKFAYMYEFTIGINDKDHIYYGRYWEELLSFLDYVQEQFQLSESRILVVYVHNLSYEFQFMRKYFNWLSVFAVDDRKPIKALCDKGIEFRDSYILSALNLEKTADNLVSHTIKKLKGDLDYKLVRNPSTPLSDEELAYCNNDVEILLDYIDEQREQYQTILNVPMTNTGRVRTYVRKACFYDDENHHNKRGGKYKRYKALMTLLTVSAPEYLMLIQAFQGGFTHCNALYSNKLLHNVHSIDFTSSYPTVLIAEQYPMSEGKVCSKFTPDKDFNYYITNYCCLFTVKFTNIKSKILQEHYLSESKCKCKNADVENGRIFTADECETTITDVDWSIISNCYTWDKAEVKTPFYYYTKGYLPKDIIRSILHFYQQKTTLKGVKGKEVEYLKFKGMLNSVFGMMVTAIVRNTIEYDGDWKITRWDFDKLQEDISSYNKSEKRFLFYPWGVWCTAYARKNLYTGILNVGTDYIYSDTDSIKFLNYDEHKEFIETYNEYIIDKLTKVLEHYELDTKLIKPKTKKGVEKPLGVWDYEGMYSYFKSLGAKRYLTVKDNEIVMTTAGLSKQNSVKYLLEKSNTKYHTVEVDGSISYIIDEKPDKVYKLFNNQMYVPPEETGKNTHTYIDDELESDIIDYRGNTEHIKALSGVHLEGADYTLSISKQYSDFLDRLLNGELYSGIDDTKV